MHPILFETAADTLRASLRAQNLTHPAVVKRGPLLDLFTVFSDRFGLTLGDYS